MALTNLQIRRPYCVLITAYTILILLGAYIAAFKVYEFNPINMRDYLVWHDPKTWDYDKSLLIKEYLVAGTGEDESPLQTQIETYWTTFFIYNKRPNLDNVWTVEGLTAIRDLEADVQKDPRYLATCFSKVLMTEKKRWDDIPEPILDPQTGDTMTECDH